MSPKLTLARVGRHARRLLLSGLALPCLAACTTVVIAPEAPEAPARVVLLDHGRHASLALPAADGGWLRYAYGDWRYYAETQTGPGAGIAALLWPTPGALGRRRLPGPQTEAGLRRALRVGVQAAYGITVPGPRLAALRERLARRYASGGGPPLYNPNYDLSFVRDRQDYDALHNSNREVANWLRALGCEVRGSGLYSRWELRQ